MTNKPHFNFILLFVSCVISKSLYTAEKFDCAKYSKEIPPELFLAEHKITDGNHLYNLKCPLGKVLFSANKDQLVNSYFFCRENDSSLYLNGVVVYQYECVAYTGGMINFMIYESLIVCCTFAWANLIIRIKKNADFFNTRMDADAI
ncbi:hypothetical protein MHBO_004814 [Bonamia ostreae]|uniref:Uncharacterized protein n=1 Tax=Bonamia ostreae TaxID=126728 RepID=A0ABV2AUB6_9EUKA